jgi:hypothetical protein
MHQKINFLRIAYVICTEVHLSLSVLKDDLSLIIHKTAEIKVFLIFLLLDRRVWIRTSVSDPYKFFTDPDLDLEVEAGYQYGYGYGYGSGSNPDPGL